MSRWILIRRFALLLAGSKPGAQPPPLKPYCHFLLPSSLSSPDGGGGRREGDGGAGRQPQQRKAMAPARAARRSCVPPCRCAAPSSATRRCLMARRARIEAHGGGCEGLWIRPLAGLPAPAGPRRRPAASRCGGDSGAATGPSP